MSILKKTVVSAPGKIHLMGEHAVVHGAPALLTAVNRRVVVTVSSADEFQVKTNIEEKLHKQAVRLLHESITIVCKRLHISDPDPVSISVRSGVPAGMHLGSSAAVAVASVGALLYFYKHIWNPELINKLAFDVEKVQHGTPSGGDNSICTYGGFVWFRKELEDLKTIWQLPYHVHGSLSPFYLVDTGQPEETTKDMIAIVRSFVDANEQNARACFFRNEEATKHIAAAIKKGDEKTLISAMKSGQKTLEEMGVVSDQVVDLIHAAESAGGAAKILGGGGKKGPVGYVLAYHHDKKKLEPAIEKHGYTLESVMLGEEGVRLETGKI